MIEEEGLICSVEVVLLESGLRFETLLTSLKVLLACPVRRSRAAALQLLASIRRPRILIVSTLGMTRPVLAVILIGRVSKGARFLTPFLPCLKSSSSDLLGVSQSPVP